MKLHELEIGDACARMVRERDAVAGRNRGIRRLAEDLAGAAGREEHRVRRVPAWRTPGRSKYRTPAIWPDLDDEIGDERVVDRRDGVQRPDLLPHRAADRAAGGIADVENAPDAVRRLEPERQFAVRVAIEARAPGDQLAHVARALFDQHAHRGLVAQPVAGPSVSVACRSGLSSGPSAAAIPPWAYPVLLSTASALVRTRTRPTRARPMAALQPRNTATDDDEVERRWVGMLANR